MEVTMYRRVIISCKKSLQVPGFAAGDQLTAAANAEKTSLLTLRVAFSLYTSLHIYVFLCLSFSLYTSIHIYV